MVREWLFFFASPSCDRVTVHRIWARTFRRLADLPAEKRWAKVRGPMAALITTLAEFGWRAPTPCSWIQPSGVRWVLDPARESARSLIGHFVDALEADSEALQWRRASQHLAGSGLEEGADLSVTKRHLVRLARKQRHQEAGMLTCVATASCWTEARRADAGYIDNATCPACGETDETLPHRSWYCACHADHVGDAIARTQHLLAEARIGIDHGDHEFWRRGIVPKAWTFIPLPDEAAPRFVGDDARLLPDDSAPLGWRLHGVHCLYTDGSGATNDVRTRRIGSAVAWLPDGPPDDTPICSGGVMLPGATSRTVCSVRSSGRCYSPSSSP